MRHGPRCSGELARTKPKDPQITKAIYRLSLWHMCSVSFERNRAGRRQMTRSSSNKPRLRSKGGAACLSRGFHRASRGGGRHVEGVPGSGCNRRPEPQDEVVTHLGYEHLRRHDLRHTGLTWNGRRWCSGPRPPEDRRARIAGYHPALPAPRRPVHCGCGSCAQRAPDGELVPKWSPAPVGEGQLTMNGADVKMPADLGGHRDQRGCVLRRDGGI